MIIVRLCCMNLHSNGTGNKTAKKLHKQDTCRNCGATGHIHRYCSEPIMSFGIICFRKNMEQQRLEYLMIQRRDSLSFMEFIRGKYELENIEYIKHLMNFMTVNERRLLMTTLFDDLWNQVWYQAFMPKLTPEYFEAKEKFHKLKQGFEIKKSNNQRMVVSLSHLLASTETKYHEPEWGFPKGRRRLKEKDVDCAVREFCEETGFVKEDVELQEDFTPYEEIFFGTNHIKYRHVYYISEITKNKDKKITIDPNNPHQAREVRKVEWFSGEEVLQNIREHNVERRELFQEVSQKLANKISFV